MKHPKRISTLFFIGLLAAGSSALGYYYYFVYEPPLGAAEAFMQAMERRDHKALEDLVIVTPDREATELRAPNEDEIDMLLRDPFIRGRVLDQDRREGGSGDFYYLVYREPDGTIYALMVTRIGDDYRIVIPERPRNTAAPYLWDYTWTN